MSAIHLCFSFLLLLVPASVAQSGSEDHCSNVTDLNRSDCAVLVLSSDQVVDREINIYGSDSILITTISKKPITVSCLERFQLVFNSTLSVVIENIIFLSCGDHVHSRSAIEFYNVTNIELTNITITNSSDSTLKIVDSKNITFQGVVIENNYLVTDDLTTPSSVVSITDCRRVRFHGTNAFINNQYRSLSNEPAACNSDSKVHFDSIQTVLFVKNSSVIISGLLKVEGNVGPSGVVYFTTVQVQANDLVALFSENSVCVNGALYLELVNASFSEDLTFQSNSAYEYYLDEYVRSVASISLSRSSATFQGTLTFEGNTGDVTSMLLEDKSTVNISGGLSVLSHRRGYSGIFIRSNSALSLTGTGKFWNNNFHNSVIRLERSRLQTSGDMGFENNSGNTPCVFRIRSAAQMNGTVMFRNNSGVLYLVDSTTSFDGVSKFIRNNVRDFGIGGAIAMFRSKIFLSGEYLFEGNNVNDVDGGVMYGHLSTLIFSGNGSFVRNSARYGGAIYLQNKPLIQLREETTLYFIENTAIKGGAFYIFGSLQSFQCINNTEISVDSSPCFIDLNGTTHSHSLIFRDNVGTEGGSVLQLKVVEDFDLATQGSDTLTGCDNCPLSLFTRDKSHTNSRPLLSSDTFRLCFCKDNVPDCSLSRQTVEVIRGQKFSVYVTIMIFDLLKANQSHIIRSYFQTLNKDEKRMLVGNSQPLVEEGCKLLNYTLEATSDKETVVISADESCEVSNAQLFMDVKFKDCPQGFILNKGRCACDKHVEKFLESCDVDTEILTKNSAYNNTWIQPYINHTGTYLGMIYYQFCPLEYCSDSVSEILPSNPDAQCNYNRTGIVCGNCTDGYSRILGSSKCQVCSNWYLFLLIPIGILGVILICFLFLTQLTVATGTIHGLILYANIVNAYRNVFFPERLFVIYTVFISWLNLDFGIETCFYDGMNQLAYIGWQFVFPLFLWLMIGCIILICHWSVRVSKYFGNSDPVAALATIILLSYNKLLQNVIVIFTVARLRYPPNATNVEDTVWYWDSNVVYGESAHIILCGVALVVIVVLFLPYTLVLVFAQLLQKSAFISACLRRLRLTPFIKVYQAPYKKHTRFWIGLCLLLRCVLLCTYAAADNSRIGLLATSFLSFLLVSVIVLSGGIYSKHRLDVLEVSFITNLGLFSLVTYHFQITGLKSIVPAYISVSVALVTFVGIVIVQIVRRIRKLSKVKKFTEKTRKKIKSSKSEESSVKNVPSKEKSDSVTTHDLVMLPDESFQLELREPLLDEPFSNNK